MIFKVCLEASPCNKLNKVLKELEKDKVNYEVCREPMYNWSHRNDLIKLWSNVITMGPSQGHSFYFLVNSIFNKYNNNLYYADLQSRIKKKTVVFERSLYTDFYVVAMFLYSRNQLNYNELKLIEQIFKYFISKIPLVNLFIRVRVKHCLDEQKYIKGVPVTPEILSSYDEILDEVFSGKDNYISLDWEDNQTPEELTDKIKLIIKSRSKNFYR